MADATVRGRFVWHELLTPNPPGAREFYGKAVGWTIEAGDPDPAYISFKGPRGHIGAALQSRAGTPQWIPYIGTTDVAATTEAATGLGGRVQTPPTELPNTGQFAVLIDPQGATFGIHASAGQPSPEAPPVPGEFSWHELATSVAPDAAWPFYSTLFGWDEISRTDLGPMGIYLIFGRNGMQLGGMFNKGTAGKPGAAYWLSYVSVMDLDGTIERTKAARGSVLTGPMDVPGGDRIAQLMDPHGAFFALHASGAQAKPVTAPPKAAASPRVAASAPRRPTATKPKTPAKKAKPPAKKPAARKAPKKPAAGKKASKARKPSKAKTKPKVKGKAKPKKRGR